MELRVALELEPAEGCALDLGEVGALERFLLDGADPEHQASAAWVAARVAAQLAQTLGGSQAGPQSATRALATVETRFLFVSGC